MDDVDKIFHFYRDMYDILFRVRITKREYTPATKRTVGPFLLLNIFNDRQIFLSFNVKDF